MKAVTVKQPWASLIADGRKTIEVRSWRARHRGPLLICAALRPDRAAMEEVLHRGIQLPAKMPTGKALCIADLVDVEPMTEDDEWEACCALEDGAFSWRLAHVRAVKPFPVTGQLMFYEVELPAGAAPAA